MVKPYQPEMTELQLSFFRALCAPFPEEALSVKPGRGGSPMTWLDKRALENRLDSVCTPMGWRPEYIPTQRGYMCILSILCPTNDGEWVWISKSDGAGFEEMNTSDDDEKSGYTNALRRAAQDAWGIGRYLYQKGVPSFWDSNVKAQWDLPPKIVELLRTTSIVAPAPKPVPLSERQQRAIEKDMAADAPAPEPTPAPKPEPASTPVASAPSAPAADSPGTPAPAGPSTDESGLHPQYRSIPPKGRPMFAWVKALGDHYGTEFKAIVQTDAEKRFGASKFMNQWSQEVVDGVALGLIQHIRTMDVYQDEFEAMFKDEVSGNAPPLPAKAPSGAPSPAPTETAGVASPAPSAPSPTSPSQAAIADARGQCAAALVAYISEVHGDQNPTPAKVKGFIAEMSPDCFNGFNQRGEIMLSINACQDLVWLNNLTALACDEVKKFRERAAQQAVETPGIPF